ncbi:MAG: hypothetical protein IPL26_09885 [Leptospiraceae bacterium]|nr:hypothetical protein [Leptospiraceae bacterium]
MNKKSDFSFLNKNVLVISHIVKSVSDVEIEWKSAWFTFLSLKVMSPSQ